jgi:hypothetical protein
MLHWTSLWLTNNTILRKWNSCLREANCAPIDLRKRYHCPRKEQRKYSAWLTSANYLKKWCGDLLAWTRHKIVRKDSDNCTNVNVFLSKRFHERIHPQSASLWLSWCFWGPSLCVRSHWITVFCVYDCGSAPFRPNSTAIMHHFDPIPFSAFRQQLCRNNDEHNIEILQLIHLLVYTIIRIPPA